MGMRQRSPKRDLYFFLKGNINTKGKKKQVFCFVFFFFFSLPIFFSPADVPLKKKKYLHLGADPPRLVKHPFSQLNDIVHITPHLIQRHHPIQCPIIILNGLLQIQHRHIIRHLLLQISQLCLQILQPPQHSHLIL